MIMMMSACGHHDAGATEKKESKAKAISTRVTPAENHTRETRKATTAKTEMPDAPHELGVPAEELQRVIGDGSAKAELDFMESMVIRVEDLDSRKASLNELRDPVNNASYSARRLEIINSRSPLTDAEISRGKALMERLNVVMSRRVPNMVTVGGQ